MASSPLRDRSARRWFVVAAVLGGVHAAFSLYWAAGGRWLVATLGDRLLEQFADMVWVLVPVGLVKAAVAVVPLLLDRHGWPWRRPTRAVCWVGAGVLIAWGGINTVVGQLVLTGVVSPEGGYDRLGMIGHAWLWDPLFLVWGLALAAGMALSRARGTDRSR